MSIPKLYFGYGSNLWRYQMAQRCPTSVYLGVARLPNFKWIINERGYANVVESPSTSGETSTNGSDEVYGLVYSLAPSDEARLDINESVPWAYEKAILRLEYWPAEGDKWVDVGDREKLQGEDMLVYVDRKRVRESEPKEEYIYRMNEGISDAVKYGVPKEYVARVMRPFISETHRPAVEDRAKKQAVNFEDESSQ